MSTRTAYVVLPAMSTAMGRVVRVLVRVVYAYRRWLGARPKDLLATARHNRLVLILAGLNALRGVATRRPNRACMLPACFCSRDTSDMYVARSYLYYLR